MGSANRKQEETFVWQRRSRQPVPRKRNILSGQVDLEIYKVACTLLVSAVLCFHTASQLKLKHRDLSWEIRKTRKSGMAHNFHLAKITSAICLLALIVQALPLFDPSKCEVCGVEPYVATGVPEASLYIDRCP